MKMLRSILWLLILTCSMWTSHRTEEIKSLQDEVKLVRSDSSALENEFARILRNQALCGTARIPGFGTRIIVALGPLVLHDASGRKALVRGQVAVYQATETYEPPTGDFFEIAMKTDHPSPKGPDEWIEPEKNTMLYEDQEFRIFEERLQGGDERQLHSHAQRFVVRLNEVQLTDPRFQHKIKPGSGVQIPNTVRFAEPIVHAVRNLSSGPLFNIVIEFKVSRSK